MDLWNAVDEIIIFVVSACRYITFEFSSKLEQILLRDVRIRVTSEKTLGVYEIQSTNRWSNENNFSGRTYERKHLFWEFDSTVKVKLKDLLYCLLFVIAGRSSSSWVVQQSINFTISLCNLSYKSIDWGAAI